MRINKLKSVIFASVLMLSVGTIAVKAAPMTEKQKVTSSKKTSDTKRNTESSSIDSVTVTPTTSATEEPSTVTPTIPATEEPSTEKPSTGVEETTNITPTVVASSKYKEVMMLTKEDIKKMTGMDVTYKNVTSIYKELKKSTTWNIAGYNDNDAKLIASRFSLNYKQTVGVLKKLTKNSNLGLKVVLLHKPNYQSAHIGVIETASDSEVNNTALKELEISIEYKRGSVELEYSINKDGSIKAEYENDITKEELKGQEAQAKIEAILEGLNLSEKDQAAIVTNILNKLELDQNYKKFEFEADYNNGTKFEFEL